MPTPTQQDEWYGPLLENFGNTAAKDYSDIFEFHPYQHALRVESAAEAHLTCLEAKGVDGLPSHFALRYAAQKHDAGLPKFYGVDGYPKLDPSQYEFPEQLAIEIAIADGRQQDVDNHTLSQVAEYIKPTKAGVRANTWGGFILCISDIGCAGGDYESVFLADGAKLRREWLLVEGDIGVGEYRDFSVWLMSKYIFTNLRGAENFSEDINPLEFFAEEIDAVETNIRCLALQRAAEEAVSPEDYARICFPQAPDRDELFQLLGLRAA